MSYQLIQRTQVYTQTDRFRYTQHANFCGDLARHVWRWYFSIPEANVNDMSPASRRAWNVCRDIWPTFSPSEQEIIRTYHTFHDVVLKDALAEYAEQHGMTPDYCWGVVKKAWRVWAIERGIADE